MYMKSYYKSQVMRCVICSVDEHPEKLKFEVELRRETVFVGKPTLNSPIGKISSRTQKYHPKCENHIEQVGTTICRNVHEKLL